MTCPTQPPGRAILRWQVSPCERVEFVQASMGPCGLAAHFHDVWSVGLILRGSCRFSAAGTEHQAPTGSVFVLPPFETHACGAASADVAYAVLYVESTVMHQHASRLAAQVHGQTQRVWLAHDGLSALFEQAASLDRVSAAVGWLAALEPALLGEVAAVAIHRDSARMLHPLQQLFHRGWAQPLALAQAQCSLAPSRWHTIRTFRRATGLTPGAYLRQLRVQKSRRWLTRGDSLADIALALGFADQAHFSRAFKQVYGVTPGRLKKLLMQGAKTEAAASDPEREHG